MPDDAEVTKDEQVVGHFFFMLIKKPWITATLVSIATSGIGYAVHRSPKIESSEHSMLERIDNNLILVKITSAAILNSLPEAQRKKAQAQIELQMAAIQMSQSK